MHVNAESALSPDQIRTRFAHLAAASDLAYHGERQPPKFFLASTRLMPPPAAEVAINSRPAGSEVVLRLMWGPLPAPFPRAVAVAGAMVAAVLLAFVERTAFSIVLAVACAGWPLAALLYQQRGERRLQAALGVILDGVTFAAKPHS